MHITIFGAGNLGLTCAATLAEKHDVTLFTRKPHESQETLTLTYEDAYTRYSTISVTDDIRRACQSDIILCTYPAFLRQKFVTEIEPFVSSRTLLGFIPGYGGVEYFCQNLINRGTTIFGLQRVPYVSRSSWTMRNAAVLSAKKTLYVAALPKRETGKITPIVEELFCISTLPLREFLSVTLAPSNPLLHTSGSYGIFKDYRKGDTFPNQIMFYEQWSDETSRLLLTYDDELQTICAALAPLDLSDIVPLRAYYESPTPEAMTKKLKSIEAFKAVKAPMRQTSEGSWVPNWEDRMFIEDYPFGVAVIKDIALMCDVATPAVDLLLSFYHNNTGIEYIAQDGTPGANAQQSAMPRNFGIRSRQDLIQFYRGREHS